MNGAPVLAQYVSLISPRVGALSSGRPAAYQSSHVQRIPSPLPVSIDKPPVEDQTFVTPVSFSVLAFTDPHRLR